MPWQDGNLKGTCDARWYIREFALYENAEYMTREENWNSFIDELRAYVKEHHHFPNKHTRLLSKVKYTRKKINDGTLEEWKKEQFLEVAN